MTRKWYATLRHPKMYPHTKFGIPTSKNIGDMDRTRKRDGRADGRTDRLTDGRTVRLLYASQSSFGGIKRPQKREKNTSPAHKVTADTSRNHLSPFTSVDSIMRNIIIYIFTCPNFLPAELEIRSHYSQQLRS